MSPAIQPVQTVLDIGCGIRPQRHVTPTTHICVDPHREYLERIPDTPDRQWVTINCTWAEAVKLFLPRSVDTVFLLDVIEHLDKAEARRLLALTQEIVRNQIIIYTPYGFLEQLHPDGMDAWGLHGGKWQEHKSGWTPEDFGPGWTCEVERGVIRTNNMGVQLNPARDALWAVFNV